jgi:8-oxo-dGTP pyrophosphatase MutT (NUDIX family)
MHRNDLLAKLAAYNADDEHDAKCLRKFTAFVQAEPYCFERSLLKGHVTASAWILNPARSHVLLTHHKTLGKWLQLGGHCDGDGDVLRVAMREAEEESGIVGIVPLSEQIFDLDIHAIPAKGGSNAQPLVPAHLHYDVRFVLQAPNMAYRLSEESLALAWVALHDIPHQTDDYSLVRMSKKWLNWRV